jgi:hypothetical protein
VRALWRLPRRRARKGSFQRRYEREVTILELAREVIRLTGSKSKSA